jgi:hypothetical protein
VGKRGSDPTALRAFFDELEGKLHANMAPTNGKGATRALSEGGLESGNRGTKRAHGPGNYFTVAKVEKKIKKALFTEKANPRRANEEVERKNNKLGNPKTMMGEKGENQGKRKIREFNGGEEEVIFCSRR